MSGSPTEAEVQTQWKNTVAIFEGLRNYFDGTVVVASGLIDALEQSLEGTYTPQALSAFTQSTRQGMSALVEPQRVRSVLIPIFYDYAARFTQGSAYTSDTELMRALVEHLRRTSATVKSRTITYDSSATLGGSNVGNGAVSRLTVDESGFNLEACHVETKLFRCRQDENTGTKQHAEQFELIGTQESPDALLIGSFGSGLSQRSVLFNSNAGAGNGGSLLRNSSFDTYSASASPKFTGWTEIANGASATQDTSTTYCTAPNASTNGALKLSFVAGTITLRQLLSDMSIRQLDPTVPYFFRAMVNKSAGTGTGGNIIFRIGSVTITTAVSGLSAGWNEILLTIGTNCWPKNFNPSNSEFAIDVEWASSSSGYLLVDDVIFREWDEHDGTFWIIRQNNTSPTAWKFDDTLEFTDTGGAPGTGKLQYWCWRAGLGCLPSAGSPTIVDP